MGLKIINFIAKANIICYKANIISVTAYFFSILIIIAAKKLKIYYVGFFRTIQSIIQLMHFHEIDTILHKSTMLFFFSFQSHIDEHSDREDDIRDCDSSDEGVNVNHQNNTLLSGMDFGRSPEHNSDSHMKYVIICLFLFFFLVASNNVL
jgi:hypothetical protein